MNELSGLLYDGVFEQPLWSTFLQTLRTRVNASYAGIFFRPIDSPQRSAVHLYSADQIHDAHFKQLARSSEDYDPLPYFRMAEGRTYRLLDLIDDTDPGHQRFLDNYIIPNGWEESRLIRVMEPSGVNAWLSISRDNSDFLPAESRLLTALAPHFRRTLRTHTALERERFRTAIAAEAMQRMDFGWLSLDSDGRVVETSPHALQMLNRNAGLKVDDKGKLTADKTRGFNKILSDTLNRFSTNPATQPRAIRVNYHPWLEMLLVPVQRRLDASAARPVAIAYLHGDNRAETDSLRQIVELFGILPSEARLALALGRGLSLSEAAIELGLTLGTARNYSKKIYAKMGARGQSDVIRFILTSVLALT